MSLRAYLHYPARREYRNSESEMYSDSFSHQSTRQKTEHLKIVTKRHQNYYKN